ncbi:MAG TPA: hypothetical protein VGE74_24300 [Gemmata sp.]
MSKPTHTFDPEAKVYRDADGRVVMDLAGAPPAESMTAAQNAVAAAFGYSPATAPDILRVVGSGANHDEDVPSQAHLDTVAAFSVESGAGA